MPRSPETIIGHRLAAALIAPLLLLTACTAPPAPPTRAPLILPTPMPTPAQNAPALIGEESDAVEDAFINEVEQATRMADVMAGAPCDRLRDALSRDPAALPSLRAYAATLKKLADQDQSLAGLEPRQALSALDESLARLAARLQTCGAPG